ncbi:hypothetical protein [Dinghuibacter silviterrae]|nr:hypothetical protein [Dinghuibacter silviterrae]
MQKIPFFKKFITCLLAGLVVGAFLLRQGVTFFRQWVPIRTMSLIEFLIVLVAVIYAFIWQARKKNSPGTLAFWQGLIRYGVAYDLASFGWEKICHLQLVIPGNWADRPYRSFTPSELFWSFFSHSYLFGCIIAGLQIAGAMLLLFRRTTLVGVFILLPVLANILLMDIFYDIGQSVVVHASIMMLGALYFLFLEFNRLKAFFFAASNNIASLQMPGYMKAAIRLSIIFIPLLLIAMHGNPNRHPALTGKYEVKQLKVNQHFLAPTGCSDSLLTVVYFEVNDGCVFEFNTPQRRWSGTYKMDKDHLGISWRNPGGKPDFKGVLSRDPATGMVVMTGVLGGDSTEVTLQKVMN